MPLHDNIQYCLWHILFDHLLKLFYESHLPSRRTWASQLRVALASRFIHIHIWIDDHCLCIWNCSCDRSQRSYNGSLCSEPEYRAVLSRTNWITNLTQLSDVWLCTAHVTYHIPPQHITLPKNSSTAPIIFSQRNQCLCWLGMMSVVFPCLRCTKLRKSILDHAGEKPLYYGFIVLPFL